MALPQLAGRPMVTDGGMETDLIFHHGVDLPQFAAFPLVDSPEGRSLLTAYYDGYAAIARRAGAGPDEAAGYHAAQIQALAGAGADIVSAYTLTSIGEAIGIVRAAAAADVPVAISFTTETDGRLPGGESLAEAITRVDAAASPAYFQVNCAHPVHVAAALAEPGGWRERIRGVRYNASTRSHAELDEAADLDEGDIGLLADRHRRLAGELPSLAIVGGCCGTDARHVDALWT
jgi:S-methylmethionine-dependent homocysteine/selenocysteine methylase